MDNCSIRIRKIPHDVKELGEKNPFQDESNKKDVDKQNSSVHGGLTTLVLALTAGVVAAAACKK